MRMMLRILSVFMFISLISPITGHAEDAKPAEAPPFTISGFVDTYYSYNLNRPKRMLNDPSTTNFDFNTNTFALSLAELVVSKAAEPVGFRLDLDYGPTTDFVHGVEPGGLETYKNIQQAYVTWATPLKVTLDMGKFVTHMGAEVIESKDNWNYTRSLLFCCAIPYYHSGLRANLPIEDIGYVNAYALNGWNNVIENNAMKTFGATVGITAIKQLPIVLQWLGPEECTDPATCPGGFVYTDKQVYDAIVTFNATDALSFMLNYDSGSLKDSTDETLKYSGVAIYARWKVDPCAVAIRYEMVNDKDNLMFFGTTPNGNKINELTITGEHTIAKNLLTRLEYRMDQSDDKIYEFKDSATNPLTNPKDSQSRVVFSAVYMF